MFVSGSPACAQLLDQAAIVQIYALLSTLADAPTSERSGGARVLRPARVG